MINVWETAARLSEHSAYDHERHPMIVGLPEFRVVPIGEGRLEADRATWMADLVLRTQGPTAALDILAMYDRLFERAYGKDGGLFAVLECEMVKASC